MHKVICVMPYQVTVSFAPTFQIFPAFGSVIGGLTVSRELKGDAKITGASKAKVEIVPKIISVRSTEKALRSLELRDKVPSL